MFRAFAEAANLKTAAVFYDTIPWKMRDIYPEPFANAHRLYIGELHHYDRVMTISHYSREQMIKVLREDLGVSGPFGNILACPLPAEFPERSEEVEAKLGSEASVRPVEILCVGTVEPRKNHELMLEAFEFAAQRSKVPMRLVIAGGGHSIEPDLAVRVRAWVDSNPAMTWEEKANDARIRELYRRCDFTIYPSVEEGFGMPILESLWYEKPAICAAFGAMAEVAEGGGCVMVDVTEVEAMAQAMCDLAESQALRATLAAETRTRTFTTWRDYALDLAHKLDLWVPPDAETVQARRAAMGVKAARLSGKGNAVAAELIAST
jgi:glycosyltransferase involved in cell wall biosynthesis